MSNRPPATFILTLADAAAYAAAFASANPACLDGRHHLAGIEAGADGTLAGAWATPPAGLDAAFTRPVSADTLYELVVASIDTDATTCWPLRLWYGPLGYGAR